MRQIATLPDEAAAKRFADYLLTLQIKTELLPDSGGLGVWVCDEDKVPQARQELEAFRQQSDDPRYSRAASVAKALRQEEVQADEAYTRRQAEFSRKMRRLRTAGQYPLTVLLLAVSVGVTLLTKFGQEDGSAVYQAVLIAPYYHLGDGYIGWNSLDALFSGQVWRVFTPMFLHLNFVHLLFNMLMLFSLGTAIESSRGTLRFLGLVLATAAGAHLAEYYLSWSFRTGLLPELLPSPRFGGMSGVLYGLFGYAWMKSKYEPELGLQVPAETVTILLVWLVACYAGLVGAVANVAHTVGLLVGMAIGTAPLLWKRRR